MNDSENSPEWPESAGQTELKRGFLELHEAVLAEFRREAGRRAGVQHWLHNAAVPLSISLNSSKLHMGIRNSEAHSRRR